MKHAIPTASIAREGACLLHAHVANNWVARLKGLFAYGPLGVTDALVISPCSAVHTIGLGFTIDVVFIDEQGLVLRCMQLKPFSIAICRQAHQVIEMRDGGLRRFELSVGQKLSIEGLEMPRTAL